MSRRLRFSTTDIVSISEDLWINGKKCRVIMYLDSYTFEIVSVTNGDILASSTSEHLTASSRQVVVRQINKTLKNLGWKGLK